MLLGEKLDKAKSGLYRFFKRTMKIIPNQKSEEPAFMK